MTTWNMAGLRARQYKVPKKRKPIGPVGPTRVDMVDRAGQLVNGVPVGYGALHLLDNPAYDVQSCGGDCGFMICGCDRRCDDCGSLLHLSVDCDGESWFEDDEDEEDKDGFQCTGCDEFVDNGHAEYDCVQAHTNARRLAGDIALPAYDAAIVTAFVNNVAPTHGTTLLAIRTTLDHWATQAQGCNFAMMNDKAYARAKSWLITMHQRNGGNHGGLYALLVSFSRIDAERLASQKRDLEGHLEILKGGTAQDFARMLQGFATTAPGSQFRFPIQQSLEHGQTAQTTGLSLDFFANELR